MMNREKNKWKCRLIAWLLLIVMGVGIVPGNIKAEAVTNTISGTETLYMYFSYGTSSSGSLS